MKKLTLILSIQIIATLIFTRPLYAQFGLFSGLQWSGYLQIDNRVYLQEGYDFSWYENRLDLQTEIKPVDNARFYSEIWIRSLGFPVLENRSQLMSVANISTWTIDIREAYVDLYEFLSDNVDIRIGRQRIAWGTGNKLNPTDNINPDDLEDIWDFGRHLSSDGIKASFYFGDYTLTAIFLPNFRPAVLPIGDWVSGLSALPPGLILKNMSDTIIMPRNNVNESSIGGIKISKNVLGYDFSVSYVYGRDDIPLARRNIVTPVGLGGEINVFTEQIYPRMHISGIDMAGSAGNVGIWAEAAVFFPEQVKMITDLSALGMGIQESIVLDDEPYVKYIVGLDYTFKNGLYINLQYLHGFIHERESKNLEDYFMFGTEFKLFYEKLKIMPVVGSVEIKDLDDIINNYALILSPEIAYRPVDNAEITVGLRWINGKGTTRFGRMKDNDEIYFRVKYSF